MTDRVLSARDVLLHMSFIPDIDAPLIIRRGLFGHEYTTVRAAGSLARPDFHIPFRRPLGELVIADPTYDDPGADGGWRARAAHLSSLLDRIGEVP